MFAMDHLRVLKMGLSHTKYLARCAVKLFIFAFLIFSFLKFICYFMHVRICIADGILWLTTTGAYVAT